MGKRAVEGERGLARLAGGDPHIAGRGQHPRVGSEVQARVDVAARAATARNHSVTHLMHKALREVLGTHVQQKGSLVDADKTRFDFTHNAPISDAQVTEIEKRVNAEILANAETLARVMDIEAAKATGAMMLFGEKYGETVRVLTTTRVEITQYRGHRVYLIGIEHRNRPVAPSPRR